MTTHFLADDDLTSSAQRQVLLRAVELKDNRCASAVLAGPKSVALIFDKPTLRTQVSFSAGVSELGGYPMLVDGSKAQIGVRESVADVARVVGRVASAVVWRTFAQSNLEQMAEHSGVPVINALSDSFHPCQVLADLLTLAEHRGFTASGPVLAGSSLAYLGDGANNMAHSYLLGGALAGLDVRIGAPVGYQPAADVLERAHHIASATGAQISVTDDPVTAVTGADAVATDTWVSMGQEAESSQREAPFLDYQVDEALMGHAANDAIFLHCLPAYRGKEVTGEVIDGPKSAVWDEAENRLHVQKAIIEHLVGRQR